MMMSPRRLSSLIFGLYAAVALVSAARTQLSGRAGALEATEEGEVEFAPVDHTEWNTRLVTNIWDTDMTGKVGNERVLVDDHDHTPIGEGDTLGLVGAVVQMDSAALASLDPKYQVGLFRPCADPCPTWPGAARFSHAFAADTNLARIALKFDTGRDAFGVVDMLTTETLKAFPMHDSTSLEAFTYMEKWGTAWALAKFPLTLIGMKQLSDGMKDKYAPIALENGALTKEYYSQLPYALADTAMKFRLRPRSQRPFPDGAADSKDEYKRAMRRQIAEDVSARDWVFDLQIQIATDDSLHPVNDGAVEWDEDSSPYKTVGHVRIPKQRFPAAPSELTTVNCIGSALWEDGAAHFNSKEFLFDPSSTPHTPVGEINEFRAQLYSLYDQVRQGHLLGKPGGAPAKCPFAGILSFAR